MPEGRDILGEDFAGTLCRMEPDALDRLARYYDGRAAQVRAAAARAREDDQRKERAQRRYQEILRAVEVFASHAEQMPVADALQTTHAATGVPIPTLEAHWRLQRPQRLSVARQQRAREIMQYAARGWTDAEIADRVGLSSAHVSRIVAERPKGPLPEQTLAPVIELFPEDPANADTVIDLPFDVAKAACS